MLTPLLCWDTHECYFHCMYPDLIKRSKLQWSEAHSNSCMPHRCIADGNGSPLQCSCLENPMDRGAWWAALSGVVQSWTRLKRLSSSSNLYTECQELSFEYSVYILALTIELTPWFSILFCHWEWANHVSQKPSFLTYTVKRLDQMISKIFTSHRILLFSSSYFIFGGF